MIPEIIRQGSWLLSLSLYSLLGLLTAYGFAVTNDSEDITTSLLIVALGTLSLLFVQLAAAGRPGLKRKSLIGVSLRNAWVGLLWWQTWTCPDFGIRPSGVYEGVLETARSELLWILLILLAEFIFSSLLWLRQRPALKARRQPA